MENLILSGSFFVTTLLTIEYYTLCIHYGTIVTLLAILQDSYCTTNKIKLC